MCITPSKIRDPRDSFLYVLSQDFAPVNQRAEREIGVWHPTLTLIRLSLFVSSQRGFQNVLKWHQYIFEVSVAHLLLILRLRLLLSR